MTEATTVEKLKEIYMFVFNEFSAYTTDVAKEFNMTTAEAFNALSRMEGKLLCKELGVVSGGVRISGQGINRKTAPGVPYMWQCWDTYDYHTEEEAQAKFDEWAAKLK